jgi:hypothetical protein
LTCFFNNNFLIAHAYKERYFQITNFKNFKFENKIKSQINIINNKFILIRYYIPIYFECDNTIHYNNTSIKNNYYKTKSLIQNHNGIINL